MFFEIEMTFLRNLSEYIDEPVMNEGGGQGRDVKVGGVGKKGGSELVKQLRFIEEKSVIGRERLFGSEKTPCVEFSLESKSDFSTVLLEKASDLCSFEKLEFKNDLLDSLWVESVVLNESLNFLFSDVVREFLLKLLF